MCKDHTVLPVHRRGVQLRMPASDPPFLARPYRLLGEIQHYEWGTRDGEAFIPRLLGIEPQPGLPYAELWFGAHPKAPSKVVVNGGALPLNEWISAHPLEILGESALQRFGPRLPFLLKVLSAGEPLSIQAHPNKLQAKVLHARDPKHYTDDNHKPEIAVALGSLDALVGVKPLSELREALERYPELSGFIGPGACASFLKPRAPDPQVQARELFSVLLRRSSTHPQELDDAANSLASRLSASNSLGSNLLSETEYLFIELRKKYPGPDVGLFAVFLLNLVHLHDGQALFTGPGIPHAYLKGNIIECMANSDNVVRLGLTPKYKDAETLLEIMDTRPQPAQILEAVPGFGEDIYPVPVEEFRFARLRLAEGGEARLNGGGRLSVLLVTHGQVKLDWEAGAENLQTGQAELLPAVLEEVRLRTVNGAEVFRVEIPAHAEE